LFIKIIVWDFNEKKLPRGGNESMNMNEKEFDTIIVGGGLSGLTAAVYLSRMGKSVLVIEKENLLGGLARTTEMNGALFNMGPHAMYEGGAALRILEELNAVPNGGYASKSGMTGIIKGKTVKIPEDLTNEENLEWRYLMSNIGDIDTESIASMSVKAWAETYIQQEMVRKFFYAMCRQWTYCKDLTNLSAGYAIKQGQLAAKGVKYVDGGWQQVVNELHQIALNAGALFITGIGVEQLKLQAGYINQVKLTDGTTFKTTSVISTIGPAETISMLKGVESVTLGNWHSQSTPLYAACLDVALRNLPHKECVFALGLDEPYYFSNHSVSVKLSNDGSHILHVMKYNGDNTQLDPKEDKQKLIGVLDLLQPGWEEEVTAMRFLPNQLVAHDTRTIFHNRTINTSVPEIKGLFVAGDWVGSQSRLADAAMESAKIAAQKTVDYFSLLKD
jgi:phytoene dehydrogenase-like protein